MVNYPFFGILGTTSLGRFDMKTQQRLTLSLLATSVVFFGLLTGCEPPAEDQQIASAPSTETPNAVVEGKPKLQEPESPSKPSKAANTDATATKNNNPSNLKKFDGELPVKTKPTEHPNSDHPTKQDNANIKKDPRAQAEPAQLLPQSVEASPEVLDLGTFSTSVKAVGTVTLTNTADEPVTLLAARASCGCTTSDFKNNTVLNPGESTDITITMDGKGKARKLSKTVTFTIDGRPPLRLEIKGETISYVTLDVDPLVIDEEASTSSVTLTSTDGQAFKVLSILPAIVANFSEEAAPTQELLIDWDSFWDVVRTTKVTIRLDHPLCKEVTTNIRLSAEQRKRLNDIIKARRSGDELPTKDPTRPLTGDQLSRYIKAGRGTQVLSYIADGKGKFDSVDRAGVSLLSTAAKEGDAATVSGLLALGASIERVDRVNRTPLMYGARSKNSEVITILLDAGADIQSRDSLGNTPLSWAAGFGISDSVRILVDAGADVNAVDNVLGYTPLLWASGFGEPGSIEVLLDSGADLEVHDTAEGRTPLMHAVRTGDAAAVEMLISAGANVNAVDNDKQTALHVGASINNVKLEKIKALVAGGADLNAKNRGGLTPLDLAKERIDEDGKAVAAYLAEQTASE